MRRDTGGKWMERGKGKERRREEEEEGGCRERREEERRRGDVGKGEVGRKMKKTEEE